MSTETSDVRFPFGGGIIEVLQGGRKQSQLFWAAHSGDDPGGIDRPIGTLKALQFPLSGRELKSLIGGLDLDGNQHHGGAVLPVSDSFVGAMGELRDADRKSVV